MFFRASCFQATFWNDFWSDVWGVGTGKMRLSPERGCKIHIFTDSGFLSAGALLPSTLACLRRARYIRVASVPFKETTRISGCGRRGGRAGAALRAAFGGGQRFALLLRYFVAQALLIRCFVVQVLILVFFGSI